MPLLGHTYFMLPDGTMVEIPNIIDVVAWNLSPAFGPDDRRTKGYKYVEQYAQASHALKQRMLYAANHAIDLDKAMGFGI